MQSGIDLTALILTYNEVANIARTLHGLRWVSRILAIDSGSSDGTLAILSAHPGVEVLHRPFDSFARQCSFGLAHIHTSWVLSLDADYVIEKALADEVRAILAAPPSTAKAGYAIPFRYCIAGRPLLGAILPPRVALYQRHLARYRDDGHGHRVVIDGPIGRLHHPILHDDRKPLERWLASQHRYMAIEARKLQCTPFSALSAADRLRKHTPLAPFAALVVCLVVKGGILDGWRGWAYAFQRMYAELLLRLFLMEGRSQSSTD